MTTLTWVTTGTVSGLANNQQGNVIAENLAKMIPGGSAPTPASTGLTTLSGLWWHDTTSNQIKLRDQADTAWIPIGTVDETNKLFTAAASGVATVQGARKNLKLDTRTGAAVVTADEIVLETTGNTYAVCRSVAVTINPAASGANGLDTGTFAANTWYAVWLITNGTTVAGLLSTSASAPTMPAGSTYKARIGWVRSNATPALLPILQLDRRARYVVDGSVLSGLRQVCGAVGSYDEYSPTYSAQAIATFVPSTAAEISLLLSPVSGTNGHGLVAPNGNYAGPRTSNPPPFSRTASDATAVAFDLPLESTSVYAAINSSGRLYCAGWLDNL
jgi:hypothetical protein